MAIDAGTVKSTLIADDTLTKVIEGLVTSIKKLETEFEQLAKKTKRDSDTLTKSYQRVSADLDPVVKRTQKYEHAAEVLSRQLKDAKISQEKYNQQLEQASTKYLKVDDSAKLYAKRLREIKNLGSDLSSAGQTLTAGITLPILAIGGASLKAATTFESSFAGVRKTVDATEEQFAQLSKGIRDLAAGENPIPIDVNELNKIAEAAGQLGIRQKDILKFTEVMANLGQTTNLTSEAAAENIAQFQNIFGQAGKDVDKFASTLVALGNDGASTESAILSMGARIAGAGKQINLTQGEVLAIASSLASLGIEAEAGGSAISTVMIEMALAVSRGGEELEGFARVSEKSAEEFQQLFRSDASAAIEDFVAGLANMKQRGEDVLGTLDAMGVSEKRMRDALLRLSGSGDLLTNALTLQAKAWKENTALTDEAKKRYETFASQLQIVWNQIKDTAITFGTSLIPVFKDFLTLTRPILGVLTSLAEGFASLPQPVRLVSVVITGLVASTGPLLIVTGQLISSWANLATIAPRLTSVIAANRLAILGWSGSLAGVIIAIGTVNHLLAENKRQQEEYQKAIIRSNELVGISRKRHLQNADALFHEARATIKVLQANLRKQKAELESLSRVNPYFNQNLSASEQQDLLTKREKKVQQALRQTELALADAREAYVRLDFARNKLEKPLDLKLEEYKPPTIVIEGMDELEKKIDKVKKKLEEIFLIPLEIDLFEDARESLELLLDKLEIIGSSSIDLSIDIPIDIMEQAANLADQMATDAERRAKAVAEAAILLEQIGPAFQDTFNRINQANSSPLFTQAEEELYYFRDAIIDSVKTASQTAQEDIARIERAFAGLEDDYDMMIVKEKAIAQIREKTLLDNVNSWANAIGFLGQSFGGLFQKIASGIQQLQSGYNAFSGLGNNAGWFGVFVAVVDIAHGLLEAHKQNKYNRGYMLGASALGGRDQFGEWQISAAQDTRLNVIKQSRDASNAINSAMEEIAEAIGGVLKAFESIQINIRRDGKYFEAIVGQELIGIYGSFEEAMDAALQASLLAADTIITGLSELVQEGLAGLQSGQIGRTSDLNQIVDFLSALKEISELNLPQGAIQMQQLTRHFDELWRQLQRMNQITPAVAQGFTNLLQAEISAWEDWSRSIRGVEQTPRELLDERKREAELFNSQKKLRIAELNLKVLELKADAERLRARARVVQAGAGLDQAEVDSWRNRIQAKAILVKAEVDITQQYIDFINAVIEAINEVITALEAIPDINVDDIKVPRVGGAGGRGEVRDFIADRRYDLSTSGMTEFQRALAELDRTYEPMIEKAGKDKKLREELLALKDREIAQLEKENKLSIVDRFQSFLGLVTPFDQVRKTAEGLIKDIEASTFGDPRKARMISRVLYDLDKQLEQLARQEAVSLFGEMISRMQDLGATDAQTFEARRNLAILEYTLAIENYRTRIQALREEGKLAPAVLDALQDSFNWLEEQRDKVVSGVANDNLNLNDPLQNYYEKLKLQQEELKRQQEELANAIKKSTDLLKKYKEQGLDPLSSDLIEIVGDFKEIRSVLGSTPEIMIEYARAVKNALDNFLEPFRDIKQNLIFGEGSPLDSGKQWEEIQRQVREAQAEYEAGDFSALEDLKALIPEYIRIGKDYFPTGSQGYLEEVYSPIEDLVEDILNLTVDDLGSLTNPMNIRGMEDLTLLTEQQLDILNGILAASKDTSAGIEELLYNNQYNQVA